MVAYNAGNKALIPGFAPNVTNSVYALSIGPLVVERSDPFGLTLHDLSTMENVYSPAIGALNEPIVVAATNGVAAAQPKKA